MIVLRAVGYSFSNWTGENISAHTRRETEEELVLRLIQSSSHYRSIIRERFTEFGVALFSHPYGEYINYWTKVFATSAD